MNRTKCAMVASLFLCRGSAFAQSIDVDKVPEPVAIVEVGGAGSWNLRGESSFGADLAVEVTPIDNWLELEAGIAAFQPSLDGMGCGSSVQEALDSFEKG